MKIITIVPNLDKTHPSSFFSQDLLWKQVESVQQQVEERHRATIWKATRMSPHSLSREVLDIFHIRRVVEPQHNRQWLEQKGKRIGPILETSLSVK